MPRNKEYDREQVLEKIVYLFWQKGFKATAMSDIIKETGLNSASMYKEFGDKDRLFEAALAYYSKHIISNRFQILIDDPDIKGIENYLKCMFNNAASGKYLGCLMMKSVVEKNEISQQANTQISNFCTELESLLETAFRNARANGDISAAKDPAQLASFVTSTVHGLVLYGQHQNKKENIRNLYEVIWQVLKG